MKYQQNRKLDIIKSTNSQNKKRIQKHFHLNSIANTKIKVKNKTTTANNY